MGGLADVYHQTLLFFSLGILLLKGSVLSVANAVRNSCDNLVRHKSPVPKFPLLASTCGITRQSVRDPVNEIDQKGLALEESREELINSRNIVLSNT